MAFRFDKFTIKAQEAVQGAVEAAGGRGNPQVTPGHLLHALLAEREGIVRPLLEKIGTDRGHLERIVDAELAHLPKVSGGAQRSRACSPSRVSTALASTSVPSRPAWGTTARMLL